MRDIFDEHVDRSSARVPEITTIGGAPVIVRAAESDVAALRALLFRRHPHREWATFARFGWRETSSGLVLTLATLDQPRLGDLDESVGHVAIDEAYTLRVALAAESHQLAVAVVHSHPEGSLTLPSHIDDDMDAYYARYFGDFAPGRPYVSLIFSRRGGRDFGTGRVFWGGRWHAVEGFIFDHAPTAVDKPGARGNTRERGASLARGSERVRRLVDAFGKDAAARLAAATVAVVGVGGTGSPAVEALARAGIGHLIVVDPDALMPSNLERVHGSVAVDVAGVELGDCTEGPSKVLVARRHVLAINPECRVTAIRGRLPQPEVIDALVMADVVIGATDQQHSRLALSDLAARYLVPVIDCGVALEGRDGRVSGQVVQLVRFLADDGCALCRRMITPWRLTQELMSEEERAARRVAALQAAGRGEPAGGYWRDVPQLNTVGYLTTVAGAMAAGYAIGWITGRFEPPFGRLQLNLSAPLLDVTDVDDPPQSECPCRRARGTADQGAVDALISPPAHWPAAVLEP